MEVSDFFIVYSFYNHFFFLKSYNVKSALVKNELSVFINKIKTSIFALYNYLNMLYSGRIMTFFILLTISKSVNTYNIMIHILKFSGVILNEIFSLIKF